MIVWNVIQKIYPTAYMIVQHILALAKLIILISRILQLADHATILVHIAQEHRAINVQSVQVIT